MIIEGSIRDAAGGLVVVVVESLEDDEEDDSNVDTATDWPPINTIDDDGDTTNPEVATTAEKLI